MRINKYQDALERFEMYYPGIAKSAIDWWPSGHFHITIKLSDSTLFEFNPGDNSLRKLTPVSPETVNDSERLKKEIGHNLAKRVRESGMPQNIVAEKCGITTAMLSRYIHGSSMPGLDKVYILANALGCNVSDILYDFQSE